MILVAFSDDLKSVFSSGTTKKFIFLNKESRQKNTGLFGNNFQMSAPQIFCFGEDMKI